MSSLRPLSVVLALTVVLCAGSAAQAVVIYSQNFNSYSDGTSLATLPGWYNWGGAVPTIQSGVAVSTGSWDFLLDMTDIFSYGNTQARIEFDAISTNGEFNGFFGPGSASGLTLNYGQTLGIQDGHYGLDYLYAFNQGGWAGNTVQDLSGGMHHWVYDLTLAGGTITWSAGWDGNPFFAGTKTLNITAPFNTMEWGGLGSGGAIDNMVITAIPEPVTMSLLALGGLALLRRNRK
ncbi:MAG: PEP-CTERM sorting domain-containing protein [Planctomycetota bacterium]|nr:PEP-CTERM sorting domain-containing protein [Planctomycetota bacterium]